MLDENDAGRKWHLPVIEQAEWNKLTLSALSSTSGWITTSLEEICDRFFFCCVNPETSLNKVWFIFKAEANIIWEPEGQGSSSCTDNSHILEGIQG